MPKSIGIVGYGNFGQFLEILSRRFLPETQLCVYSRREELTGGDFGTLAEAAACDVVVLCVAISEYEEVLRELVPLLRADTVVVDVATVKEYTEALCASILGQRPYLCLHPMFGPESYKKKVGDVSGFRIVVTGSTLPAALHASSLAALSALGFSMIPMTSQEHDRVLAETLFLTHYLSQSVRTAGFGRTAIDTLSFQSLMDAVEAVQYDRRLFEDVYRFNPYCQAVADRFRTAQEEVWQSIQQ